MLIVIYLLLLNILMIIGKKIDNVIGYFYSYNYNTKEWILREHNTVTYTGIIYYKNKKVAAEAFELSKEFYEMLK